MTDPERIEKYLGEVKARCEAATEEEDESRAV